MISRTEARNRQAVLLGSIVFFLATGILLSRYVSIPLWTVVQNVLAAHPAAGELSRIGALAVALALSLWCAHDALRGGEGEGVRLTLRQSVFVLLVAAVMLLARWSHFGRPELNPDEGQEIAGAITLLHDPRYWISVDGFTHAPLTTYVLLIPRLLGLALDYGSARLVGVALLFLSVLCFQRGLRLYMNEASSRLLSLPVGFCVAFMSFWDYVAYNSEHLTILLLVAAAMFGSRAVAGAEAPEVRSACVSGFVLGLVPYSKLQGIPIAVVFGLALLATMLARHRGSVAARRASVSFISMSLLPTVILAAYLLLSGTGAYFWKSYVVWNFSYADRNTGSWWSWVPQFIPWVYEQRDREIFAYGIVVSLLIGVIAYAIFAVVLRRLPAHRFAILFALCLLASALFAVIRPANPYQHYLLFLLFPLAFLTALLWHPWLESGQAVCLVSLVAFMVAALILPLRQECKSVFTPNTKNDGARTGWHVAAFIRQHTRSDDPIVVWGWAPRLYVMSGRRQGVRHSLTYRELEEHGGMQGFFRDVFLRDFDATRPPMFIDAVGDFSLRYTDRARYGHETFRQLRERIDRDYRLAAEIEGTRIFLRKP